MTIRGALLAGVLATALISPAFEAPLRGASTPLPSAVPGHDLPIVHEYRYRMRGRVRMLLFWVSRDDVGGGVIRERRRGGKVAYEVSIGTDPSRAPRGLNRWGFLAEAVEGDEALVVGVITNSDEGGPNDVRAETSARPGAAASLGTGPGAAGRSTHATDASRPLDTIRSRVTADTVYAVVSPIRIPASRTLQDSDAVVGALLRDGSAEVRTITRPADARPGFLTAVTELIHQSVQAYHDREAGAPVPVTAVSYVYGDVIHDLRLLEVDRVERLERGDLVYTDLLKGRFETRRQDNGKRSAFDLFYETVGDLAEVPVLISYKPRWWLHVELLLEHQMPTSIPF